MRHRDVPFAIRSVPVVSLWYLGAIAEGFVGEDAGKDQPKRQG